MSKITDKQRLDWLEKQASVGLGWLARESSTGRGFRLHQAREKYDGAPTAREAIDRAMEEERQEKK